MSDYLWQLALADAAFLILAACLGIWFRRWLRGADEEVDRRLRLLDAQSARLERLALELDGVCQRLEQRAEAGMRASATQRVQDAPQVPTGRGRATEERYAQAWKLVDQGLPAAEVARRLEMGLAEVELMQRIQRYRSRS